MGLNYRKHHTFYQGEGMQDSVLQDGVLYTADGKKIPEDVSDAQLSRVHIPPQHEWMRTRGAVAPNPFAYAEQPVAHPLLAQFSPEQIAAACRLLQAGNAANQKLEYQGNPGAQTPLPPLALDPDLLIPPIPDFPMDALPSPDQLASPNPGLPLQPKAEMEEVRSRGIVERRPKGGSTKMTIGKGR